MPLTISSDDGVTSTISDSALLVWIDETGNEDLSDPSFPLFGLGGCVVSAHHYLKQVCIPWRLLKKEEFGDTPSLHANELRLPTESQMASLSKFFDYRKFGRIGSVVSNSAKITPTLEIYEACAFAFGQRIAAVASMFQFESVVLLVEASQRGDVSAKKWLSQIGVRRAYDDGKVVDIPMQHFLMPKCHNEPGLEVADFIAHTAGREGRIRNRGYGIAPDFKHIFKPLNRGLASFIYVQKAGHGIA